MTIMKSLSLASASTQKTYRYFSGRSMRLTNGDRHVSPWTGVGGTRAARVARAVPSRARLYRRGVMVVSLARGVAGEPVQCQLSRGGPDRPSPTRPRGPPLLARRAPRDVL